MDTTFPTSLPEFQRVFPDDAACASYLEAIRWPVWRALLLASLIASQPALRLCCVAEPVRKIRLSLPGRLCSRAICRSRLGFGALTS
jgi:hypothetical protein